MKRALILNTIQQDNILPLISPCNCKCVFCSHSGNPKGLKTLTVGVRPYQEVVEDICFLDAKRDIVIGESATQIIEGEPFLYPHIKQVLAQIRDRYLNTLIKVTTNGTLLNEETVQYLADLKKIEINLSLNAVTPSNHKKLTNNLIPANNLQHGLWLAKYAIPFHGSIVAMPWLTGWDELKMSLKYLQEIGAITVRVFMPGFSRYSPEILKFAGQFISDLKNYIIDIRKEIAIPVLLEPPFLDNLIPMVAGVLKGSVAEPSDIRTGDVIQEINGYKPLSRVDAWMNITKSRNPKITIARAGQHHEVILKKEAHEKSGIVCEYDLDMERAERLKLLDRYKTLIVTSQLAYPLISQIPSMLGLNNTEVTFAENITFGGSISCAGLMMLEDIEHALNTIEILPEKLVLPSEMFNYKGYDLLGKHYTELEKEHKVSIEII